jgi:hypothetical protein
MGTKAENCTIQKMMKKKQQVSLMLLACFLAWQTNTVFHLLFTPHVVCKHGKIVDADPESGRPLNESKNKGNPNHEGCRFISLMTSAKTRLGNDLPLCAASGALENTTLVFQREIEVPLGERLFRISPSNSPPHFA